MEFLAAVTGIFCYKKYKDTAAKYFIYFLIIIAFSDSFNYYAFYVNPNKALSFLIGTRFEKNHWWTTLYWKIGAIMFFAFYYRKILLSKVFKNIIKYASYGFLSISAIYILFYFDEFFYKFFPIISVLGAVIVFLCTVFYFLEILQSDDILTFYRSLNFYISVAIFIWWLIITPLVFYNIYFTYEIGNPNRDWNFVLLRRQIYLFSNIFMYLTFTYALIWCQPESNENIC
ncbi:hypothetical protein [Changchengzhania lutea]|uniref:hypothetical protein n=1 Tax=Changchengzhania lutea TaxID=2049305 RepID=UPI001FE6F0DA|nr:hypothetical protein [Changchengzhania lutea]